MIPGAAEAEQIQENIPVQDCYRRIADKELSEDIIKHIQLVLKSGTLDSEKEWFAVGDYKKRPNMIGDMIETIHPSKVESEIKKLLKAVIWALNKERLINSGFMI